jgi:DNA mismatch endonuclease (patch repair protein)
MSSVRGKDTKPEIVVRRLLYGLCYLYRLHAPALPGASDIVFKGRCKAIYVNDCFWHRHPDPACKLAGLPKFHRDLRNQRLLHDKGWSYLLVGAGGLGISAALAGLTPLAMVERDRWACETISGNKKLNFPLVSQ